MENGNQGWLSDEERDEVTTLVHRLDPGAELMAVVPRTEGAVVELRYDAALWVRQRRMFMRDSPAMLKWLEEQNEGTS